jgi:hypothetical protein
MEEKKGRSYVIEVTDGETNVRVKRTNDGFKPYELLGILEQTKGDILAQMAGQFVPETTIREAIVDTDNPRTSNEVMHQEAKKRGFEAKTTNNALKSDNPYGPGSVSKAWAYGWECGDWYEKGQIAFVEGGKLTENPFIHIEGNCRNFAAYWADGWHKANKSAIEKEAGFTKSLEAGSVRPDDVRRLKGSDIQFTFSNSETLTLSQLMRGGMLSNDRVSELNRICQEQGRIAYDCGKARDENPFGEKEPADGLQSLVWENWDLGWAKRKAFDTDISERFDEMRGRVTGELPTYGKDAPEQFKIGYEARFNYMRRCTNPHLIENTAHHRDFMKTIKSVGLVGEWDLGWKAADAMCAEVDRRNAKRDEKVSASSGEMNEFQKNAFHTGHGDYSEGKSLEDNPYTSGEAAKAWTDGWELASKSELCRNARYKSKMNWHFEGGRQAKLAGMSLDDNPFGNTYDLRFGRLTPSAAWDQGFIYECDMRVGKTAEKITDKRKRTVEALLSVNTDLQAPELDGFTSYVNAMVEQNMNPYDEDRHNEEFELWRDGWDLAEQRSTGIEVPEEEMEAIITAGIEGFISDDENPYVMLDDPKRYAMWQKGWNIGKRKTQSYWDIAFNKGVEDAQNGTGFNPFESKRQQQAWEEGYATILDYKGPDI